MTLPAATRARLRPLVLRLASDQPGEVVAAVAAIERVLRRAGLDWHALADVIDPPSPASGTPRAHETSRASGATTTPPPGDDASAGGVLDMVDAALRHPERLSRQEVAFLFEVATRARAGGRLSARQERTLRRLYHTATGTAA